MIITVAYTVSRARAVAAAPPLSISETISDTLDHGDGKRKDERAERLLDAQATTSA
jgi:hypothetical protein